MPAGRLSVLRRGRDLGDVLVAHRRLALPSLGTVQRPLVGLVGHRERLQLHSHLVHCVLGTHTSTRLHSITTLRSAPTLSAPLRIQQPDTQLPLRRPPTRPTRTIGNVSPLNYTSRPQRPITARHRQQPKLTPVPHLPSPRPPPQHGRTARHGRRPRTEMFFFFFLVSTSSCCSSQRFQQHHNTQYSKKPPTRRTCPPTNTSCICSS